MEIFKNSEWVVTDDSIEALAGDKGYWIEMDEIFRETSRDGIAYYTWPIQLAEKNWVAIPLFFEAFLSALRCRAKQTGLAIDEPMLARTYGRAIETALLIQQFEADCLRAERDGKIKKVMWLDELADCPAVKRYGECERATELFNSLP